MIATKALGAGLAPASAAAIFPGPALCQNAGRPNNEEAKDVYPSQVSLCLRWPTAC